MKPRALIFDFDGVVADSETLACAIAAAYATELGAPMSGDQGLTRFMGKRVTDVAASIAQLGGAVPADFAEQLQLRTLAGFAERLEPVSGVEAFLKAHRDRLRCIASSSSHARLDASLARLGLRAWFEGHIYSVDDVARGKPFPDLFLYAAAMLNCRPSEALVIEDSVGGVTAAVAAGMPVIGLLAGTHVGSDHAGTLIEAGATAVARSYDEVSTWIAHM